MANVANYFGQALHIPEDRLYDPEEGFWVREEADGRRAVGLSQAGVIALGKFRETAALAAEGEEVTAGQTVLFALTGKVKYFAAPLGGRITYAPDLDNLAERVAADPYDQPLFYLAGEAPPAGRLLGAAEYAARLAASEGGRSTRGVGGPSSATCKAVYYGIGQQTLGGE
ncbi:MAG: hypothetical protein KQJ78_10575 [Deltaproteobacteria bacterium]|nr:hypothetical protein [Deltaproteobacteria bacterium]